MASQPKRPQFKVHSRLAPFLNNWYLPLHAPTHSRHHLYLGYVMSIWLSQNQKHDVKVHMW